MGTNQKIFRRIKQMNIKFPKSISNLARDFISKLLKKKPSERLRLPDVPNHDFIKTNLPNSQKENEKIITEEKIKTNNEKTNISLLKPSTFMSTPKNKKLIKTKKNDENKKQTKNIQKKTSSQETKKEENKK